MCACSTHHRLPSSQCGIWLIVGAQQIFIDYWMNEGTKSKEKVERESQVDWEPRKVKWWGGLKQMEKQLRKNSLSQTGFKCEQWLLVQCPWKAPGMSIVRGVDKAHMSQTVWESSGKPCSAWILIRANCSQKEGFKYEPEKVEDLEKMVRPLKNRLKGLGPTCV